MMNSWKGNVIKEQILNEILVRKRVFKLSSSDMVSAYNREVETDKEYNGRQLLELLQNADDEKSDEVKLELDTEYGTLIISNRGESCRPFSFEGVKSLMISNLSSKLSKKFIGNKGLGFRSIISWSEKIIIQSNGLDITFSKEVTNKVFNELFNESEQEEIRQDRKLPDSINPIPFLSIPEINNNHENEWTTCIIIEYKSQFLQDIQKQLVELKSEILLFLNSIQKLTVVVDNETLQEMDKAVLFDSWSVFERKNRLPKEYWDKENEEEHYSLKIALQDNLLCETNELFAFFPTKIEVDFPFIIHGTFELNSSRNELNDSPKNRYILKELVRLIISTAKEITDKEISYKALKMLLYAHPNNILEELNFYEEIDAAIKELEIYPCLDGKYRAKSEVLYNDELSIFIKNTNNEDLLGNLLIPNDDSVELNLYEIENFIDTETRNILSLYIKGIEDRAELIHLFYYHFDNEEKLELLIDTNEELISLEDDVYTPSTRSISIPDFINIKFMHNELFDSLIKKFEINSNEKSRDLQRTLKEITNIQSYEPAQVLQKIVASTNKVLKQTDVNHAEIIKKMVKSLYQNYIQIDKTNIPPDTKVQLLNREGLISDAKNLYLSKTYPSGELTEFIFENIYTDQEYLADVETYELQDVDVENLEKFFLWLGVNKYAKFNIVNGSPEYKYFVFDYIEKPLRYRDSLISVKAIDKFDSIASKLSKEKLILWFCADEQVSTQLDDATNTDKFSYSNSGDSLGTHPREFGTKPSYITYQIKMANLFRDYVVGIDKLSRLINQFDFNFEFEEFEKNKINRADIESIMLKIGAVDRFDQLSADAARRIVKELPSKAPNGKQSQSIYKLCIKHYERHKEPLGSGDFMLFATRLGEKSYFPRDELFYDGYVKLPKKITDSKAVLYYPKRQSTANVTEFFGIKNHGSLDIKVTNKKELISITQEFKVFLEQLKPFILAHRIQDIEVDRVAAAELSKLKNIKILLCEHIEYSIAQDDFVLEDNDYIKNGRSYLVKINSHDSLSDLKSDFDFQESFSDIVGLVFDIQDTKVFRDMIKEDIFYIEKAVRNDIGSDELIRARELLGISDEHLSFWKTTYSLLEQEYSFESDDILLDTIIEDLQLTTNISKIDFSNLDTYESCLHIKCLFEELNIAVVDFNKCETSYYKIDFRHFHAREIKQAFENYYNTFERCLYAWCLNHLEEKSFNDKKAAYNHNDTFIAEQSFALRHKSKVEYAEIVALYVQDNFMLLDVETTNIDYLEIYKSNKKLIEPEDLCGNADYISLLYFDGKVTEIQKYIESLNAKGGDLDVDGDNNTKPKLITDANLSPPPPIKKGRRKSKKPYKHNSKSGEKNKAAGNKSEQEAYNSLVNDFGEENVVWSSNDDDSLGYDIKYKTNEGQWKYVEVKTYSGKQFHITKNEIKFAQANIGLYELFLVGDTIHKLSDVDFNDTNKLILETQEYIVHYSLGSEG